MRCLLDKVTARHIMEGMLKLVEGRTVTSTELFALYFYQRARSSGITLFILPQTHNLLKRIEHLSRYVMLIRHFLAVAQVAQPARYFKRWTRRLREHGFTKEDAEVLALATFGTTSSGDILGMHVVATFDQPMINRWTEQRTEIQRRLLNMRSSQKPYSGNLRLQIPPDVHVAIARAAEASGKDLDQWATETFTHAVNDGLAVQSKI